MGLNLFALAAAKLAFSHRYGMSLILPYATPYDTYLYPGSGFVGSVFILLSGSGFTSKIQAEFGIFVY